MNSVLVLLGIEAWKPLIGSLLLPPIPLLVLLLFGARLIASRRVLGWSLVAGGSAAIWLSACTGTAQLLSNALLRPPPPLASERIAALKSASKDKTTAIVVLGGGKQGLAPEYRTSSLNHLSLERLRYGLWLGRETAIPVAFSGGLGWGESDGAAESQIAARIAADEFGRPLKWIEDRSRDTRENATLSIAMLEPLGIKHVVLVTHDLHMPRAMRAFEEAAQQRVRIEAAPMGLAWRSATSALNWAPTANGWVQVRYVLHELLGLAFGA